MNRPTRRTTTLTLWAAGVAALGLLTGCASGPPEAAAPAPVTVTAQPPAGPTVTVTAAPPVEATPTPQPKTKKAQATKAAPADVTFVMPGLVGMVLQDAQDLLQTKGSYIMDQQDATGLERLQLLDANWKVCSQSPKKGAQVPTDTTIVLRSVKLYESCP